MQFALISTYYLVLFIDLQGSGLVRFDVYLEDNICVSLKW